MLSRNIFELLTYKDTCPEKSRCKYTFHVVLTMSTRERHCSTGFIFLQDSSLPCFMCWFCVDCVNFFLISNTCGDVMVYTLHGDGGVGNWVTLQVTDKALDTTVNLHAHTYTHTMKQFSS